MRVTAWKEEIGQEMLKGINVEMLFRCLWFFFFTTNFTGIIISWFYRVYVPVMNIRDVFSSAQGTAPDTKYNVCLLHDYNHEDYFC